MGAASGRNLSDVTADPLLRPAFTYWLALAVMAAAVLGTYAVLRSRLGLDLRAIRGGSGDLRQQSRRHLPHPDLRRAVLGADDLHDGDRRIGTVEGPVIGALAYFLLDKYFAQSGVWYLVVVESNAAASVPCGGLPGPGGTQGRQPTMSGQRSDSAS